MLTKIAEIFIFGFTPLMLGALMAPTCLMADEIAVSGEVIYRERIALPKNAVITVQLADVSLADAPAAILAEKKIVATGQVPVPFELKVDPAAIQPNMSYALQARITVDDTLWFVNDVRHALDPKAAGKQTVLVRSVRQETTP